jgi:hypothetical protein
LKNSKGGHTDTNKNASGEKENRVIVYTYFFQKVLKCIKEKIRLSLYMTWNHIVRMAV